MSMADLSFVILTWNSEKYIINCIESIIFALKKSVLSYEIFIIDNGSKDKTIDILNRLHEKNSEIIKPLFLDKNRGTTYSRNLALRKVRGKYVCIMDSDVEIFPGVIDKLIENLEFGTDTGLSAPRIVYPNGRLQKSTDIFPTITRKIYRYLFLKKIEACEAEARDKAAEIPLNTLTEVDYAISAMWLLKRNIINDIGLLDEKIFYAPEDVDYCIRIWNAFSSTVIV